MVAIQRNEPDLMEARNFANNILGSAYPSVLHITQFI